MTKVAAQFGLSDRGLAKLCQRHQIPVPGRGYWARLLAGQSLNRTPLPDAVHESIEIYPHEKGPTVVKPAMLDKLIPGIEVLEDRPITHRHAVRIDKLGRGKVIHPGRRSLVRPGA